MTPHVPQCAFCTSACLLTGQRREQRAEAEGQRCRGAEVQTRVHPAPCYSPSAPTKRLLLGPSTVEELREAHHFLTTTFHPWPHGSTSESVAASIRRLRALGILPERHSR